jgi:hypothetical protein
MHVSHSLQGKVFKILAKDAVHHSQKLGKLADYLSQEYTNGTESDS